MYRSLALSASLAVALFASAATAQNLTTAQLQTLAVQDAQAAGVDPATFVAQIQAESSFNPNALNRSSGTIGIGQFLPSTAADAGFGIAPFDPHDPVASLQAAAQYDAALARRDGSLTAALTDYTGGLTPSNPSSYSQAFAAAQAADAGNPNGFVAGIGTPLSTGGLSTVGTGTAPLAGATAVFRGAPTSSGGVPLSGDILDQIVQAFQTATQSWQSFLLTVAQDLFWLLAGIDLIAALIMLAISGHGDWSDVVGTILRWLFPVGLFSWVMMNGSQFAGAIINSLRLAANAAGGSAITPSAVLTAGINAASTIWTQFASFFHPVTMTVLMLAALVIVICFCLMATWMAAALIEGYFIIGASSLLLAFGGMHWSRDIAISLLRFCLGIGMKLFAISMIVAVGNSFVQQWAQIPSGLSIQGLFTIVGASVFLAAVAKVVPDTMQRVILGSPYSLAHPSHVMREAGGAAALAATPVLATAGFTALALQAFREAAERLGSSERQSQTALGRMGQMTLGVGQSLGTAAGAEIGGRLGGLYRGGATASAARMAAWIAQSRRVAAAEQTRPTPPQTRNNP